MAFFFFFCMQKGRGRKEVLQLGIASWLIGLGFIRNIPAIRENQLSSPLSITLSGKPRHRRKNALLHGTRQCFKDFLCVLNKDNSSSSCGQTNNLVNGHLQMALKEETSDKMRTQPDWHFEAGKHAINIKC